MNYCSEDVEDVPYTRITEHKHFAPGRSMTRRSVIGNSAGHAVMPYYPVHLVQGADLLDQYAERSRREERVSFVGRLGMYRYMDMDVTIRAALDTVRAFLERTAV